MNFLICLLDVALVFTPIYECDVLLYARMYLLLAAYRARLLSTMAPLAFIPVIIGRKYRYFCHRSTFFFFFRFCFWERQDTKLSQRRRQRIFWTTELMSKPINPASSATSSEDRPGLLTLKDRACDRSRCSLSLVEERSGRKG